MDKITAYNIAQNELLEAQDNGFDAAVKKIGVNIARDVKAPDGHIYEVEIINTWSGLEKQSVKVNCTVTSKNWYQHEQISESITLCR